MSIETLNNNDWSQMRKVKISSHWVRQWITPTNRYAAPPETSSILTHPETSTAICHFLFLIKSCIHRRL